MQTEDVVNGTEGGSHEEVEGDGDRSEGGDVPAQAENENEGGGAVGEEAGREDGENGLGDSSEPRESERLREEGESIAAPSVPSRSTDDVGLPFNRVKRIMKVDPDIRKVSTEAFKLVTAATGIAPPGTCLIQTAMMDVYRTSKWN